MSAGLGVVSVGAIAALIIAAIAAGGNEETAPAERDPWTLPIWTPRTPEELAELGRLACSCSASAPQADDAVLGACIWAAVWPGVPYPPIPGDHASLAEAQARVLEAIGESRKAGYCTPAPAPSPSPSPSPSPGPSPSPAPSPSPSPSPAPIDVGPWINEAPWPGNFYQVREGDIFLGNNGICARALYAATYEAAIAAGMTQAKASARAAAVAADPTNRLDYLNAIQCSPWNDALYGTWGYGDGAWPSAHGRAIRLIDFHDAVYDRLSDGEPPRRLVPVGSPADAGKGTAHGKGSELPLLWLPTLRASSLLDPNRTRQVDVDGITWPDGSPTIDPPPEIASLGIDGAPNTPWGCVS